MTKAPATRIAVVTDDGVTVSAHFGRARFYRVVTVVDGRVVGDALREKAGHHTFATGGHHAHGHEHEPGHHEHGHHEHGHEHEHGHHEHDHEQGHGHGPHGHGTGPGAAARHAAMTEPISDCAALLARGMGRGAHAALQEAGIEAIVTNEQTIDAAVRAYLDGTLENHLERLH